MNRGRGGEGPRVFTCDGVVFDLDAVEKTLREIVLLRKSKNFAEADALRAELIGIDPGVRITLTPTKASLWHVPIPPHRGQFHYLNYPTWIANTSMTLYDEGPLDDMGIHSTG